MKPVAVLLFLGSSGLAANIFERATDVCSWHLNGDDCICMNSQNGALLKDQTATCCTAMGLKTTDMKCHVAHDNRQTFKDCCKWLNIESCIGHCR